MIRTNLAVLLIFATCFWVVSGMVEASSPVTAVAKTTIASNSLQLWHGVDANRTRPSIPLRPRTIAAKPATLGWPADAADARLMVKFNDDLKIRVAPNGMTYSRTGADIDSLMVILEQLEVTLTPVYNIDETRLQGIINQAEFRSGKAQPDLPGTFYIDGDPAHVDQASVVLLHDHRVEWAQFKATRLDPRVEVDARRNGITAKQARPKPTADLYTADTTPNIRPNNNDAALTDIWSGRDEMDPGDHRLIVEGACVVGTNPVNAACTNGTFADCTASGGIWQGNGTLCANIFLDTGSCCLTEDNVAIAPMLGGLPSASNPLVVMMCTDKNPNDLTRNINASICLELEGVFTWGQQCSDSQIGSDPTNPNIANIAFTNCNLLPLGSAWEPTGACCSAGDCDVVTLSECDGIWITTWMSRYNPGSPSVTTPALNPFINPQLLATTYGLTNFVVPLGLNAPAGVDPSTVDESLSNTAYSFYSGLPIFTPFGTFYPGAIGSRTLFEPAYVNGNNNVTNFDPGSYRRGLIDFRVRDAAGGFVLEVADLNVPPPLTGPPPQNPDLISGGMTLGNNTNATGLLYNPNLTLACLDTMCEFGVCAISCWAPLCDEAWTVSSIVDPSSPLLTSQLIVPAGNSLCTNFFTELGCQQMYFRSRPNAYNPTGSLYQDLVTGFPALPVLSGCQAANDPTNTALQWFAGYYDPQGGVCCPPAFGCTVEPYEVVEGADPLRGTCYYSHSNYPTMFINQVGILQAQGTSCYGDLTCAAYCNTEIVTDDVCAVAPLCCDLAGCDGDYSEYGGWSFICSDIANALWTPPPGPDPTNSLFTDFDQYQKYGGPYPQINGLNLTTPVWRNLDGSIDFTDYNSDGVVPDPIAVPPKCLVNYHLQNQCYTAYFSEYQPSLSLATANIAGNTEGGCADFECCHRVCSITELDPVTGFNYASCCTVSWTNDCVDKAQQICYFNEGGHYTEDTPNFVPLQFHLSEKIGRGTAPIMPSMRRLATAPMLAPSIISPIPGDSTLAPDNWLQSVHQIRWLPNPSPAAQFTTFLAPSVLRTQLMFDTTTGEILPVLPGEPAEWDQFYFGNPPSPPIRWWTGAGLSLYGNAPGTGWGVDPSFLSPSFGLYTWGQFMAELTPGHHPWGPHVNGTAGAGIKIAVLDYAAWVQEYVDDFGFPQGAEHEDLTNVLVEGPELGFPYVKMLFDPFVTQPQRGTAVLGTIAAQVNSFGVNGIATQAVPMFFPVVSADTGLRETDAWVHAIESLGYGDLLLATYPAANGNDCLVLDADIAQLIAVATGNGIGVIIPVGDAGNNVEAALGGLEDTGALIIGGAMPSRLGRPSSTSNYVSNPNSGFNGLLPIASAFSPITTTGGDCNLTRMSINTEPDTPFDPSGYISRDMAARSYTNDFGLLFDGSKASAAQGVAVAACLQGFSLQRFGIPQSPALLRRLLWKAGRSGDLVGNGGGGASPDPTFGKDGGFGYSLNSEGEASNVGGFLDPAQAGVAMVIDPEFALDSSEYLYDFKFIRGLQQYGMITSLEEEDQNYLTALSEPTDRGSFTPPFAIPGSPVTYLATGHFTDLYIIGIEPSDREILGEIQVILAADLPSQSITEVYMYSFSAERWLLIGAPVVGAGGPSNETFQAGTPNHYFDDLGYFHMRIVTHTGPNTGSGPGQQSGFLIRYDHVDFAPSGPTGGQDGDGG